MHFPGYLKKSPLFLALVSIRTVPVRPNNQRVAVQC